MGSVAEIIAKTCWEKHSPDSVLLALLSPGLDADGVVAQLAVRCLVAASQSKAHFESLNGTAGNIGARQDIASPLFFVLVSDGTEASAIYRIAGGVRQAVTFICAHNAAFRDNPALPPTVHAVEEGSSPKQRSDAYLAGGIVVMGGRFFCADVLHQRVTLHFSLAGAVVYIPCSHRHWLPLPTAPRRVAKHLPSLAFATELLCARNSKINRQGVNGVESYASRWPWSVDVGRAPATAGQPLASGEGLLPQRWCLKAPLFMVSDHPSALAYCLRSRTVLEGRTLLKSFHVGVMEVFPRFRLDIVKHMERSQSLRLELESTTAAVSPVDAALARALRAVVQEVLDELKALEARLAPPTANGFGAIDEPRRKQPRTEKDPSALPTSWSDAKRPCGVNFAALNCSDVLSWDRNGLEVTIRDALNTYSASVVPYRRLLRSLEDVLYLVHQLPLLTPGTFRIVLENLVAVEQRFVTGVGGANSADARRPLWTLSDRFADIVQLTSARVFHLVNDADQKKVIVHHCVDSDGDDDHTSEDATTTMPAAPRFVIQPPSGGPGEYLTLIKTVAIGWVRTMARKVQQHRRSAASSTRVAIPSMLMVVEEESTLRQIVMHLCMEPQAFARVELERFLVAYQRLHGANLDRVVPAPQRTNRAGKSFDARRPAAQDDSDGGPDDDAIDDDARGDGDVAQHILTQRSARASHEVSTQPPPYLSAAHLHHALLSQPLTHAQLLTALDAEEDFADAVAASLSNLQPTQSTANAVEVRCVGRVEGCVVLSATVPSGGDAGDAHHVVMIRVVNASYLTPHQLLQYWLGEAFTAHGAPAGGQRRWSENELVPPFGRVVLCSPTLRTLRIVESFQDLVTASSLDLAESPKLKIQILQAVAPPTSGAADCERSATSNETAEENTTFHQLLTIKSMLTEVLFVDRDARLDTEQQLRSGLSRSMKQQNTPSSLSLASMPMYLRLRRTAADAEAPHSSTTAPPTSAAPLVIFDEREFRSSLPYHLYCQGFDVLPLTLLNGDYLLSSSYALERKAIPDLIQSLNSGRIHNQLSSLSRMFTHPVLLVEFTKAAAFRLSAQDGGMMKSGDTLRRLMCCLAANPRVHVLWSRSAQHTASMGMRIRETFSDATTNADASDSSLTQKKESEGAADTFYAMRVLRTFPGVDNTNVTAIMNAAGSLAGLASLSQQAIVHAIGHEKGTTLHNFLHGSLMESV